MLVLPRALPLACLLAFVGVCSPTPGDEPSGAEDTRVAALRRLPASPRLLETPPGVSGDFDVAAVAPEIDFAAFPHQSSGAKLWSSWGEALCASDGCFYASIGDHGAPRGTAYVYRVDPAAGEVRLVVDVNSVIGETESATYTPGKIHGGLAEAADGRIYFFGYRGSEGQTTAENGYRGDWLLRYDPIAGACEDLGIPLAHQSVPVLLYNAATDSLVGMTAPGLTSTDRECRFFRHDLGEGKTIFHGGPSPNVARALILADDGRAWYSHTNAAGESLLLRYDPASNDVTETAARLPGAGQLRAASLPDERGVCWCVTQDGTLFSFDTKREAIEEHGPAFVAPPLYTATCRLDPRGRYLYYLPGAHGGTRQIGTPVVQYDTRSGRRKVLAFLDAYLREAADYAPGGTYGMALSADGGQLFVNLNGALPTAERPDFGLCAAVVVHIPASERKVD